MIGIGLETRFVGFLRRLRVGVLQVKRLGVVSIGKVGKFGGIAGGGLGRVGRETPGNARSTLERWRGILPRNNVQAAFLFDDLQRQGVLAGFGLAQRAGLANGDAIAECGERELIERGSARQSRAQFLQVRLIRAGRSSRRAARWPCAAPPGRGRSSAGGRSA
jgi:hypothetical protein